MEKRNEIKETIFSFFKNKVPRNAQLHFQYWFLKKENAEEKDEAINQLWNEIEIPADETTYKDLKEIHSRIKYLNRKSRPFYVTLVRTVAVLLLPILTFTVTYFYFRNTTNNMEVVQYYVPKGETKHLVLSDGTEVWINSDSYLSFPKKFALNNRTVNLNGEAYFQVVKNFQKPFIVCTDKMNVEALGTKFNVNAYPDLSEVKTILTEGRVQVNINNNKKTDTYTLSPNEELSLNIKTGDITKRAVEANDYPAWDTGILLFNAVLLPDIFKQVEKKYGIRIACNIQQYEDRRLTVKFENGEDLNEVLDILQLMVPDLEINRKDSIVYIK